MPSWRSRIGTLSTLGTSTRWRRMFIDRGAWPGAATGQHHRGSLAPCSILAAWSVGHALGGAAVNREDAIVGAKAGLFGRAAADDADDHQLASMGLQLDPQADEVALDLRIDFAELVGREVGRIGVQAVGGAAQILEHHGGRPHFQPIWARAATAATASRASCARRHILRRQHLPQLTAELFHGQPVALGQILLRNADSPSATSKSVVPRSSIARQSGNLDVMGLNLQQHTAVQVQRPVCRQLGKRIAETAVGVAAAQVVVQPRQLETPLQAALRREKPQGVFVVGQGFAPTPLRFQLLAVLQQIVDLQRARTNRHGGRLLGRSGNSRENCQYAEPRRRRPGEPFFA